MNQPMKLAIFDSNTSQLKPTQPVMFLWFEYEEISAKDLICRRVTHEVEQFQQRREIMNTLVPLQEQNDASEILDSIDAKSYCQQAIQAFEQGSFFIIVDEEQITEINELIRLRKESEIAFFRLAPLVGG